ncbi:MAG: ATP-binding protein [Gammaproteobacteria bacterium]
MKQAPIATWLSPGLENTLRRGNPWWQGDPMPVAPPMRRWVFPRVLSNVESGGLAPVTIVRGPRQIGKTTLLGQVIAQLLEQGVAPKRLFLVQFDDLPGLARLEQPILDLAFWHSDNILGKSFHRAASEGEQAYLFLDEVQNLGEWAPQLKHLVDLHPVRAVVTGSSALRIEAGRDSLAGRISTLEMGPLLLREIGEIRGFGSVDPYLPLDGLGPMKQKDTWLGLRELGKTCAEFRRRAFAAFSERGAYPIAQAKPDVLWEQIADQLNETVVRRAIQHDLRMGAKGKKRDEHLLEEVFRLACRYIGQSPNQALYLEEIRRAMNANIGWQRVLTYLKFLDGTLLLRLIEPLELRLKRRRSASKLCLCDHALRAAWLQEVVPLDPESLEKQPHLADLAGHIAESAVGYFLRSIVNLDVAHFPERGVEAEVDYVITIGEQRIPVEVKYRRRIDYRDTLGLRAFVEKAVYNAPFGVLVTLMDEPGSDDPRIVSVPLSTFLMMR